jgi:hypothetical protein
MKTRVDEQGRQEWVRCAPGDTLVVPINALHAFHNRTDKPTRFISSSVYYHEVFFEQFVLTVDVEDPLPAHRELTEEGVDFSRVCGTELVRPRCTLYPESFRGCRRHAGAGANHCLVV